MTTEGVEAIFLETHNWGQAARFWQALGYELEFETDHSSGQFRNGNGPYLFVAEVSADRQPDVRVVFKVADAGAFKAEPAVEVVAPFEETHWGTQQMVVRDSDGRLWSLEAPGHG